MQVIKRKGYVYIHDGARPFIDEGIIERAYECVCKSDACIAGMPVKDTIKIVNERQRVESTPDRATLWAIQTPQVFLADLLLKAYGKLMKQNLIQVTDKDFTQIRSQMDHLNEDVVNVSEEISQIMTANDSIVESISQISAVSEEVSANTSQAAEMGYQTSEQAAKVGSLMNELQESAVELEKYI